MRVLSSSLTGLVCIATLMAATATPGSAQPSAMAFEGKVGGVQLIDHRDRRKGYGRGHYRGYYGHYYGPYYAPYAYYGPYWSLLLPLLCSVLRSQCQLLVRVLTLPRTCWACIDL
jgi:hypothetical protein